MFIQEGEYTIFILKSVKRRAYFERGRSLQITEAWINKEEENFTMKIFFSNFSMLWHVVLPSMPKREIVGYNYPILCCLWCYTNFIQVIYQNLLSSVGLQRDLLCLPSISSLYLVKIVAIELWRLKKVELVSTKLWRLKKVESMSTEL